MIKKRDEAMEEFDRKISKLEREYREVKKENTRIKDYVYLLAVALFVIVIIGVFILRFTGNAIYEDYSMIITEQAHWKMNDYYDSYEINDSSGNEHDCNLQGYYSLNLNTTGKINGAIYNGFGGSYSCTGGNVPIPSAGCTCSGTVDESYCNQWDGYSAADCSSNSAGTCSMNESGYGNDCHTISTDCSTWTTGDCEQGNINACENVGCDSAYNAVCESQATSEACNAYSPTCTWALSGQSYDYAVCDASTTWNTVPFTFNFWTQGTSHTGHWMGSGVHSSNEWRIEGNGNPYVVMSDTICVQASDTFNDGNWHMATITVNADGRWRWYTDGLLINESICDTPNSSTSSAFEFWKIGSDSAMSMTLDDVRFYSGEMNADQIKQIYSGGSGTENELYFNSTSFNVTLDSSLVSGGHYSFINFENSLRGWWRGEGNTLDSSGNGYNGTWNGTEAYASSSYNSSFSFDGTGSSKVNLGNLNTQREFTLSMWVNATSLGGTYHPLFVQRESCGALNMQLYAKNAGQCSGHISGDVQTPYGTYQLCGTSDLNVGQLYHLIETYDGSQLRLYVDGVLNANMTAHGNLVTSANSYLGSDGCNNYFNGTIDEVLFFDRALNAEEILALNSSSNYYSKNFITLSYLGESSVSAPILHYKLNDNYATQLVVDTNGVYNGTSTVNTITKNTTGKINNALIFDGNTIDTGSNFSQFSDGNFTATTWFKVNSQGSVDGVFSNGGSGTYNSMYFTSYHASFGGMYFTWFDNTNTEQSFNTGTLATTGVWHHMAVTKVGTLMSFYYDGKLLSTKTTTATLAYPTNNLKLGTDGYGNNFNGNIDDFRLYDYGLTAGAIANIYNRNRGSENETFGTYEYESLGYAVNNSGVIYSNSSYSSYTTEGGTAEIGLTLSVSGSPPLADTTNPLISWIYPTNISYTTLVYDLNYTASDETALDSCWYSVNGGANSTRQDCNTNWSIEFSDGSFKVIVYANDTSGNTNSSSVTFFVDPIAPTINFTAPTSSGTITADAIYVNLTTSDTNTHYSFLDFDNSLSLWLRMDNINGSGSPTDLSSYSINGSKKGSAVQTNIGKFGKGFDFTPSGTSYIELPISNFNNPTTEITISAWVYANQFFNYNRIVSRNGWDNAGNYSWILYTDVNNRSTFGVSNGSTLLGPSTAINTLTNNTWYHIVGTYNGTVATIYINGLRNASLASNVNTTNIVFTPISTYLRIGSATVDSYFNGTVDEVMIFNRSLSASEILSLYNATANQYEKNFTSLATGSHTIIGYAVDSSGNKNQTETRTVILEAADTTNPLISYVLPTLNNNEVTAGSIFVNVSITEDNFANVTYSLYNLSGLYNRTEYFTAVSNINWSVPAGNYTYEVNVTDSSNNKNATALRNITILPGCEAGACTEGNSCVISNDCYLNTDVCSGGLCQFTNMTISANLYTLYDASGNGNNLDINLTSNITSPLLFLTGGKIIFSGRNGSDIGSGSVGGNAGLVNITVINLLNTTHAFFEGIGGYSTISGSPGGNGGNLSLFFHGLLRKFSDWNGVDPETDNTPILAAGNSVNSGEGSPGTTTYTRSLSCPRDPDITDDGLVESSDVDDSIYKYNCKNGESVCTGEDQAYTEKSDINCDDNINVIELSREGFQWKRGEIV